MPVVEAVESDDGGGTNDDGGGTNDDGGGTNSDGCRRLEFHPEMMKKMVVGRRNDILAFS